MKIKCLHIFSCIAFFLLLGCKNPVDDVEVILFDADGKSNQLTTNLSRLDATHALTSFLGKQGKSSSKINHNGVYIWGDRYFFPDNKADALRLITLNGYVVNQDATVERIDTEKVGKWYR
jgi:hypothetical protein